MHLLRFENKLNEVVCDGFIFANLFNSLYLLVRLWWNILVAKLATNFQDLVAKVKKLVALAPVLGAISRPGLATKTLTMALNSNFESRVSISCLCTYLWQFCFLLCLPPQHSPEQSRLKKKRTCLRWITFPRKSWSIVMGAKRSHYPIGLQSQGKIISWRGTSCLQTFMS